MAQYDITQLTQSSRHVCEDRVAVIQTTERTIIVVADGAGGVGSGDQAAETVIREVTADHSKIITAEDWETTLRQIDYRVGPGESTAVVVDLRADSIVGASVGDSQAWIVHDGTLLDLTANQKRKPLIGSGRASPLRFSHPPLNGTLIVATDGFCNYVKREQLTALVAQSDLYEIPRHCVEMVRLPSGDLWDDIGIVACRVRRPSRARKRYTI